MNFERVDVGAGTNTAAEDEDGLSMLLETTAVPEWAKDCVKRWS